MLHIYKQQLNNLKDVRWIKLCISRNMKIYIRYKSSWQKNVAKATCSDSCYDAVFSICSEKKITNTQSF